MLGQLLRPECEELIRNKDWASLRVAFSEMDPADIAEIIEELPPDESAILFRLLPRHTAAIVFEYLPLEQQTELVQRLATEQLVTVLNEMAPDDRTRLFEELPASVTKRALRTLNPDELKVARQLLGYPERSAGRFMTPEYLAIRPTMTAGEALAYLRANGRGRETLNVIYITDDGGGLQGELRLSSLVMAAPDAKVGDLEDRQLVSIQAMDDREEVVSAFEKYDRVALPVVDSQGVLVGIITVDDVLDVAEEEATEDIQRMGGMEALDAPYLDIGFFGMIRKRVGWLIILFFGETFTISVLRGYEEELSKLTLLSMLLPLIVSSGGNSGSQATTLVIRSLATREVRLRDWPRVLLREVSTGFALGLTLGTLGFARIVLFERGNYSTDELVRLGLAIGVSLLCVVICGTFLGSMLPMLLRRIGLDPATASAPFVATLVDITGVLLYMQAVKFLLTGILL